MEIQNTKNKKKITQQNETHLTFSVNLSSQYNNTQNRNRCTYISDANKHGLIGFCLNLKHYLALHWSLTCIVQKSFISSPYVHTTYKKRHIMFSTKKWNVVLPTYFKIHYKKANAKYLLKNQSCTQSLDK